MDVSSAASLCGFMVTVLLVLNCVEPSFASNTSANSALSRKHTRSSQTTRSDSPFVVGTSCGALKVYDTCGVCGGDDSSCQGQGRSQGQDRPFRSVRSRGARHAWKQVWTACSVSCGVGQRRRVALCVNIRTNHTVREHRCRRKPKPYTAVDKCVQPPCSHDRMQNDETAIRFLFEPLSEADDLFRANFGDLFSDDLPALPKFYTGEWGPCTVTCGRGTRSREVTCKRYNTFTGQEEALTDWDCFGAKPETLEHCDAGPCRGDLPSAENEVVTAAMTYRWSVGDFTECSRTCRGGTQESRVRCVETNRPAVVVSPALCAGQRKPVVVVRPCNTVPCPPRWDVGDYGECTKDCGGGVMGRRVRCVQEEADDTLTQVEDFRCPDPAPVAEVSCNNVFCPTKWATGPWRECSETCGIGVQTRRVFCQTEPVSGHRVTVSDTACQGPPPSHSRQCSVLDCPDNVAAPPVIKAENYTFIQLRRARKVRLTVGGKIVLLPGQSITVRCPVKNYHRRLIFWSKRFKLIPMVGRVRATFNGNLKIRKANPASDSGLYTCMAGSQSADVRVTFLSRKEAVSRIKNVRQYLRDDPSRAAVVVRPGEPKYQDGVFQDGGYNITKKFIYMADDWSSCSVTCGSGHQKRRVTCTRVSNKYVKILPDRECERLGLAKPEDMRKCSPHPECPQWSTGGWSACSLSNCQRDGYAERRRRLSCVYSNGTSALSKLCPQDHRPETARQCVNIDCISHWTTSRWTSCRPSCGQQGYKMRMLTCSWKKTGLPAFTACRIHSRPVVKKICKLRPCPGTERADCRDNSRYCTLARMLKMCRYDDFRRKCCKSCTAYLQSTLS